VGTAIALFSRGKDLRLEQGTSIQMMVQRAIDIDANRIAGRPLRGDLQRYDPQ
jgi:cell division GTPase FtsZ